MARTIATIEKNITDKLEVDFDLSTSAVSEWSLWVHCVAYCIYVFELILDAFKSEMDADANRSVAGTVSWYNEVCYEFQLGDELIFDETTGLLSYATEDEEARIVKIAAVNVTDGVIIIRVATEDGGNIIPLTDVQVLDFKNYIDAIKFAGTNTSVISTEADDVKYNLTVYYQPSSPVADVEAAVLAALEDFKTAQKFGGVIYEHKLIDAVINVSGVVTASLTYFAYKAAEDVDFVAIDTLAQLHAGYFNFTDDSTLTLTSIYDV